MSEFPWGLLPAYLALAWVAGLMFAQPGERTSRGRYALWALWAGVIYPAGAILCLSGVGREHDLLLWLGMVLYLGQVFVLGVETARRLEDAGRNRWLGLPVGLPGLGLLPALGLLLLHSQRDELARWRVRHTVEISANS